MTALLDSYQNSSHVGANYHPRPHKLQNCLNHCSTNLSARAFAESNVLQSRLKDVERIAEHQMRKLTSLTEIDTDVDCRWFSRFMPKEF